MTKHVDATFYAQVAPEWGRAPYGKDQDRPLRGAKVVAITQNKPARPKGGALLVKLTIRVPEAAFLPLRPAAIVVIPENLTEATPIEAMAGDPA